MKMRKDEAVRLVKSRYPSAVMERVGNHYVIWEQQPPTRLYVGYGERSAWFSVAKRIKRTESNRMTMDEAKRYVWSKHQDAKLSGTTMIENKERPGRPTYYIWAQGDGEAAINWPTASTRCGAWKAAAAAIRASEGGESI